MENTYLSILKDIQSALEDAQNDPRDLDYETLRDFYERVCASVTSFEDLTTS